MRTQLKLLVYFMIVLNVCSLFMNITQVSGREVGIIQDFSQTENFTYNIDIPLTNGSYANRIAVENFEYDSNLNLSKLDRYTNNKFSLIVKDFNDIDFDNTNNTYVSKKCEITTLRTGTNYYLFDYNISNDYRFNSVMGKSIIQDGNMLHFIYMMYYGINQYFYINFELHTGDLIIGTESVIYQTYIDFLPIQTTYEYLYTSFTPMYAFSNHTLQFASICYNQSGQIIQRNSTIRDLYQIGFYQMNCFSYMLEFNGSGKKASIIALDNNFIADRRINPQVAKTNNDYTSSVKLFYLTKVPFYTNSLIEATEGYRYATTIYKGRYLRYLTNASYNYNEEYDFNGIYDYSFSFQFGFALNDTLSLFEFHSTYFYFNDTTVILDFYDNFVTFYLFDGSTLLRQSDYAFEGFFDNFTVVHAQFKSNIFSLTFLYNFTQITEVFYINYKFDSLILFGYITNFDHKSLNSTSAIQYSNNTIQPLWNDVLSFKDKISVIESYFEFTNNIVIESFSIPSITINDVVYSLKSQNIIGINVNSSRSSDNGAFSLTNDNEIFYSCFDNDELNKSIATYLLYGKSDGTIRLIAKFYQSSISQISLTLVLHITRFLVFTDRIPENNLLIAKAIEILLPIMIFFLIVIGFKSNSDSKYLPIIGMYIGIFTLYLMEYMSLLFMVLCFIFQTIGLYIIIKKEKMEGI